MRHVLLLIFAISTSAVQAGSTQKSQCVSLPDELSTMVAIDQSLRDRWDYSDIPQNAKSEAELPRIIQQTNLVDRVNTRRLKRIVQACGWPKKSVYGDLTVGNAWLLAQHADIEFQRFVLPKIEEAVANAETPADHLAFLLDRIATHDGKPQLYGTQLVQKGPCEWAFGPLDDRETVDARRKAIGWPTLDAYMELIKKSMAETCPIATK